MPAGVGVFKRVGSQSEVVYVVTHESTGRRLGTVRQLEDGSWFALRGSGPARDMVHSGGHATRKSAAEALR